MVTWGAKVCGRKTKRKQSEGTTAQSNRSQIPSREADFGKGWKSLRIPRIPQLLTTHFGLWASWADLMASLGS